MNFVKGIFWFDINFQRRISQFVPPDNGGLRKNWFNLPKFVLDLR